MNRTPIIFGMPVFDRFTSAGHGHVWGISLDHEGRLQVLVMPANHDLAIRHPHGVWFDASRLRTGAADDTHATPSQIPSQCVLHLLDESEGELLQKLRNASKLGASYRSELGEYGTAMEVVIYQTCPQPSVRLVPPAVRDGHKEVWRAPYLLTLLDDHDALPEPPAPAAKEG